MKQAAAGLVIAMSVVALTAVVPTAGARPLPCDAYRTSDGIVAYCAANCAWVVVSIGGEARYYHKCS